MGLISMMAWLCRKCIGPLSSTLQGFVVNSSLNQRSSLRRGRQLHAKAGHGSSRTRGVLERLLASRKKKMMMKHARRRATTLTPSVSEITRDPPSESLKNPVRFEKLGGAGGVGLLILSGHFHSPLFHAIFSGRSDIRLRSRRALRRGHRISPSTHDTAQQDRISSPPRRLERRWRCCVSPCDSSSNTAWRRYSGYRCGRRRRRQGGRHDADRVMTIWTCPTPA
jgi:hypothetical protein